MNCKQVRSRCPGSGFEFEEGRFEDFGGGTGEGPVEESEKGMNACAVRIVKEGHPAGKEGS
jgi:hypothetical protein